MDKKDRGLSYLLVAAGSIMFYTLALPMLDSVSSWVQNCFNFKNAKLQHDVKKYQEDETPVHAIGFSVPSEEDSEYVEEDDG